MKIKEYEIVDSKTDEEGYEYEEMSFGELLEKTQLTEEEKIEAMQKRFSVNIHCMISEETFDNAWETLQDRLTGPRLESLKAIVFLSLKKKGRGINFTPLAQDKFKKIVQFAMDNNVGIGFDSCSAFKYLKSVEDHENFKTFEMYSEPCESSAFSVYCNTDGKFFPCSFSEEGEFGDGLDIVNCDDFMKDIWNHPKTVAFRKSLLATASGNKLKCRECPLFEI